MPHKQNTNCH